jgi:hypothetical protein
MNRRCGAVGVASLPLTLRCHLGGGIACSPFALVQGAGVAAEALGTTTGALGATPAV